MIFQFNHLDEICTAFAVFNAFQISDTTVIEFIDHQYEFGQYATFRKNQDMIWDCEEEFKFAFPATYTSLCQQLTIQFPDHKFQFY